VADARSGRVDIEAKIGITPVIKNFASQFRGFALAELTLTFIATSSFAGAATTNAASAQGPQQVVVTNTPAQPVPMVGLVKDSDASARKPFQWNGKLNAAPGAGIFKVTTVPPNQRLVIENVSGNCTSISSALLSETDAANSNWLFLPRTFWNGADPASTLVRLYVNPGGDLDFTLSTNPGFPGFCLLGVSGYYVDLP